MMVPSGARIMIHKGTQVKITQALGNSYTIDIFGNLARVDGKDADALGQITEDVLSDLPEGASLLDKVWAQLKTVFDPEIPVNIVDLGLVYHCDVQPSEIGFHAQVTMTLTAPGCGMGPVIADDAKDKIERIPEINTATVEIVFDPPWNHDMMSDAAKLELGVFY